MVLDIIVALILAYAFYSGYSKGIIGTFFSVVSIFIGILAAMKLSPIVIGLLDNVLNINPAFVFIIGFVLTFILVIALIRFIGNRLEDLLKFAHLNFINKIGGGLILTLAFAIGLSYALVFLNKTRIISESAKESSLSYALLAPLPEATKGITESVKPLFRDFWDKVVDTVDEIKEKGEELQEG